MSKMTQTDTRIRALSDITAEELQSYVDEARRQRSRAMAAAVVAVFRVVAWPLRRRGEGGTHAAQVR